MGPPANTEVTLHQYRHVKPGGHFTLSPGMNVFLGKNGTGKTTALALLARLAGLNTRDLDAPTQRAWRIAGEGLEASFRSTTTAGIVRPEHARHEAPAPLCENPRFSRASRHRPAPGTPWVA